MHTPNSTDHSVHDREQRRAHFFSHCGFLGLFGIAAVVITDLVAALVVDDYSIMSQSISSLAVGRHAWIQDLGLYCLSVGVIAVAAGLAWVRILGGKWIIGVMAVALIGADIAVIAYFHGYAGQQNRGANIHIIAVCALGVLFAASALLIGFSLQRAARNSGLISLGLGALWIIAAPFFFSVPSDWFGLYERGLGLILVCWIGAMAFYLRGPALNLR